MAKTKRPDRPKSRLPDGRVNPDYTKWRKENIQSKPKPVIANFERAPDAPPPDLIITKEADGVVTLPIQTYAPRNLQPEALTLRVIGFPPNKYFVWCDQDGERVAVRVNPRYRAKLDGKTIPVREEQDGTLTHAV